MLPVMTRTQRRQLEQQLLAEVSEAQLMQTTRAIAQWVRLSGSADERKAVDYVRGVLDGYGLRTQVILHDAYISLPGPARLEVLHPERRELPCITHSMAKSTGPAGLTGTLVYTGAGTPAELANLAPKGKIALVEGLAMGEKIKPIEAAGAIAQVHINDAHTHEMITSMVWGSPSPETLPELPQTPILSVTAEVGETLKRLAWQGATLRLTAQVETGWRQTPLLIADLPGQAEDDFVLFSGHIDSWHYGAMDNGSANATMVEVARILARHRRALRRGLRLAFWSGHSHGRYSGSSWYADQYWEELHDHAVAHVNVDSVGGRNAVVLTEGIAMAETKALAADILGAQVGQTFHGSRPGRSGDQSFVGIGLPSLFMSLSEQPASDEPTAKAFAQLMGGSRTGGLGWWWHTTEDTVDKLDPAFLARDCKVYLATLFRFCTEPVLPLDYAATAAELRDVLTALAAQANFDLSQAITRAAALEHAAQRLNAWAAAHADTASADPLRVANEALKTLGRKLIPLNYTRSGRFGRDLAYRVPPLPHLQDVVVLGQLDPAGDDAKFLTTRLVRARNEVAVTLREALAVADEALRVLEGRDHATPGCRQSGQSPSSCPKAREAPGLSTPS